jgi:hypothetical protein
MTLAEGISMSDEDHDRSFWLELESASKGLRIVGDKYQADRLKQPSRNCPVKSGPAKE